MSDKVNRCECGEPTNADICGLCKADESVGMTKPTVSVDSKQLLREDIASRLRATVQDIRRKPYPISDLIPLLTQAADALSQPAEGGEVWGWAIEDKHGVAQAIRPARKEFFGCVQSTEPFTAEDIVKMDREWAGIAPHHVVTLYTTPPTHPPASQEKTK